MADVLRVCAISVLFAIVAGGSGILSAKGFYCRDPDTGKLYTVNTTWTSTTFCGSYTCRLRKRNLTNSEYPSIRQFNLTNVESFLNDVTTESPAIDSGVSETTLKEVKLEETLKLEPKRIDTRDDEKKITLEKVNNLETLVDKSDRYLTQPEIKVMTDLLHSVKKSDLEAILEIYNIAKDIYKEVDRTADENILQETIKDINQNNADIQAEKVNYNKKHSYWYEPLIVANSKPAFTKDGAIKPIIVTKTQNIDRISDLIYEGSNTIAAPQPVPYYVPFDKEYPKLPYYYPMSNFQRLSSYVHVPSQPQLQNPYINSKQVKKPCQNKEYSPWLSSLLIKKPIEPRKNELKSREPLILPFPFAYVHHYNATASISPYFSEDPWSDFNLQNRRQNVAPSYVEAAYVAQIPNSIVFNPNIHNEVHNKEQKSTPVDKRTNTKIVHEKPANLINELSKQALKKTHPWQTDELSSSVLDEIRANIGAKSKIFPFPYRKKAKLERVGKVKKIEEHSRSKREVNDEKITEIFEEYDVYLEKNRCQSDEEPGFFRVGNLTEPFPACCPVRIGNGPR